MPTSYAPLKGHLCDISTPMPVRILLSLCMSYVIQILTVVSKPQRTPTFLRNLLRKHDLVVKRCALKHGYVGDDHRLRSIFKAAAVGCDKECKADSSCGVDNTQHGGG